MSKITVEKITPVQEYISKLPSDILYLNSNLSDQFSRATEFHKGIKHSKFTKLLKNYKKVIIDATTEITNINRFNYYIEELRCHQLINLEDSILTACKLANYNPDNILYLTCNYNDRPKKLKIHHVDSLYVWYDNNIRPNETFLFNDKPKTKHFNLLSLKARLHRFLFVNRMYDKKLLDKGYVSFNSTLTEEYYNFLTSDISSHIEDKDEYKNYLNRKLIYTIDDIGDRNDHLMNYKTVPLYVLEDSYISLVLETSFGQTNFLFITEKSLRPFNSYHFPIFVAEQGTVEQLRNLGFDLFDDILDHSYDTEYNHSIRLNAALTETERMCNMPLEELHNLYVKCKDRFIRNQETLINLAKQEKEKLNELLHVSKL